jgi:hypothetical protein
MSHKPALFRLGTYKPHVTYALLFAFRHNYIKSSTIVNLSPFPAGTLDIYMYSRLSEIRPGPHMHISGAVGIRGKDLFPGVTGSHVETCM